MLLDHAYLLFNFSDKVNAIISSFSGLNPIQGSSTFSTIQGLKRSHLDARLITVVVGNSAKGSDFSHEPLEDIIQALNIYSKIWFTRSAVLKYMDDMLNF